MKARSHPSSMRKERFDMEPIKIRRARPSDAARLAELSGQLGYPASRAEIARRMKRGRPATLHAIFVAESESGVSGWLHVSVTPLLEVALRAEVNGLVVDENMRSLGAGAKLLAAAERWAEARGCESISVRSNVVGGEGGRFCLL